ncbi:MAG: globin [Bryobacter sp.]
MSAPSVPQDLPEDEVFAQIGVDGFQRLVAAFYAQVPTDSILGPMYPADDMEGAEERLRDFLIFRFGGPQDYLEKRGHPRLRMRHAPYKLDEAARNRWVELMDKALAEAALPAPATETLRSFFHNTATFLRNA